MTRLNNGDTYLRILKGLLTNGDPRIVEDADEIAADLMETISVGGILSTEMQELVDTALQTFPDEFQEINNGGDTDYYDLPLSSRILQDLIEHKEMGWNVANIFKAAYRIGDQCHSEELRDINKIIWFAERQKAILLASHVEG